MSIHLRVYGTPASQGSKRWLPSGRMIEADKKLRPWRNAVIDAVVKADSQGLRLEGPLEVWVTFLFDRPKAHYGTGKNSGVLRENAPVYLSRTPDIDKAVRATLDGITEAALWGDDAQVAVLKARKMYAGTGEAPGAIIDISAIGERHE